MGVSLSPESMAENPIDFRAPPPSPVACGRRSSVTNDDVLTEFLENSLRVPDLVLPDKMFPRQKIVDTPPKIDFLSLSSLESDSITKVLDSVMRIGCFQLVNHGIPSEFISSVLALSAEIFRMSPEKKGAVMRSPESQKPYGFEDLHGEDDTELGEDFVWAKDESFKLDMESIWPVGYNSFSEKMETLLTEFENIAEKILQVLKERIPSRKWMSLNRIIQEQEYSTGSICYIHKHRRNISDDQWASSLGCDMMRMLIRGTDYSHALGLHICDKSSEFHLYSKKGWVSFCPDQDAIVVTIGDQTQASSGAQYKHVLGRPIFKGEEEHLISMAILFSPPSNNPTTIITTSSSEIEKGKTISLAQQALLAVILILVFQILTYFCK